MSDLSKFIDVVIPDDTVGNICIMTLPNRHHQWFMSKDKIAEYIRSKRESQNVYWGLSTFGDLKAKSGKGIARTEENVLSLMGIGIDVDIAGEGHKGDKALPLNQGEAMDVIYYGMPIKPTLIINSGNGIQAFYMFKEPWIFDTEEEKDKAKKLWYQIIYTLKYHSSGIFIDPTYDLSRVMRVPGTFNLKDPVNPKPTKIVEMSGRTYNPDSFDDYLIVPDEAVLNNVSTYKQSGGENPYSLVLKYNAKAPSKIQQIIESDTEFMLHWRKLLDEKKKSKKTRDGKEGDASLSVYDFNLALTAVNWDWSAQEIADMIIEFRRTHHTKPEDMKKALSLEYQTRTIQGVMEKNVKLTDIKELRKLAQKIIIMKQSKAAGQEISDEEYKKNRSKAIEKISRYMGKRIKGLRKYMADPPYYEFLFEDGQSVNVGSAKNILNQGCLQTVVFENMDLFPESLKKEAFENMITFFSFIQEVVETSAETRSKDGMFENLNDYLQSTTIYEDKDESYSSEKAPFKHEDRIYLFGPRFRDWLHTNRNVKLTPREFGLLMKQIGCRSEKLNFVLRNGKYANTSVYDITEHAK